jgi:hypothetical protein
MTLQQRRNGTIFDQLLGSMAHARIVPINIAIEQLQDSSRMLVDWQRGRSTPARQVLRAMPQASPNHRRLGWSLLD